MNDNIVLRAVVENPHILRDIVNDPDNHLGGHPMIWIERQAFQNIERQARIIGRTAFARASANRHRLYRNYLNKHERYVLRKEVEYLKRRHLSEIERYREIARLASIKFGESFGWRDVKAMLEISSEVIADIEQDSYVLRSDVA